MHVQHWPSMYGTGVSVSKAGIALPALLCEMQPGSKLLVTDDSTDVHRPDWQQQHRGPPFIPYMFHFGKLLERDELLTLSVALQQNPFCLQTQNAGMHTGCKVGEETVLVHVLRAVMLASAASRGLEMTTVWGRAAVRQGACSPQPHHVSAKLSCMSCTRLCRTPSSDVLGIPLHQRPLGNMPLRMTAHAGMGRRDPGQQQGNNNKQA